MRIIIGARQSGKTTECIKELRNNMVNTYLIVINERTKKQLVSSHHNFDTQFKDHILTANEYIHTVHHHGLPHNVIIDECDQISEADLVHISTFNKQAKIIMIATTLDKSYNLTNSWTLAMMKKYGYDYAKSLIPQHQLQKLIRIMPADAFDKDMQYKFREGARNYGRKPFVFR